MATVIQVVDSPALMRQFIDVPYHLHAHAQLWTPQLQKDELRLLDTARHPFWLTARRELFLAMQNGIPIGRIAAIIDSKYNGYSKESSGAFGFFECADDQETADSLLNAAKNWLADQGMKFMRGPFNPSANYTCGMLVHGFDLPPTLMMPWNPPYYPVLLEQHGLRKEEDLLAYLLRRSRAGQNGWLRAEIDRLKREARFTVRPSRKATLEADIHAMLEIYRQSWAANFLFSPLSEAEARQLVKDLKGILDPDFFVLFEYEDKPVAGMVALPDFNPLLRKLNGRIGLSAPWHYWRCRDEIRRGLRIMLFGILPEYRLYGLPLLLLDYMLAKAHGRHGLEWVEGSWILERNYAMNELLEDFSGELIKRYRIYRGEFGPCPE